jgi:hypothetical protein
MVAGARAGLLVRYSQFDSLQWNHLSVELKVYLPFDIIQNKFWPYGLIQTYKDG